jgi:hypothetical protein
MITMWILAITINGLAFTTIEPFNSEEGCVLAAKTIGAQPDQFTCISRDYPIANDQSN